MVKGAASVAPMVPPPALPIALVIVAGLVVVADALCRLLLGEVH